MPGYFKDSPRIHDLTMDLRPGMPIWPGDKAFERQVNTIAAGQDICTYSQVTMSLHTGTHLDPPGHYLPAGETIDRLEPGRFILPAVIIDIDHEGNVRPEDLAALPPETLHGRAVIFRTANTRRGLARIDEFITDFVGLSLEAAEVLINAGVGLVGVDYLSVEVYDTPDSPVHRALARAGIPILEGLDLTGLTDAEAAESWTLVCLPLKIREGDGSPCRAVLLGREASRRGR